MLLFFQRLITFFYYSSFPLFRSCTKNLKEIRVWKKLYLHTYDEEGIQFLVHNVRGTEVVTHLNKYKAEQTKESMTQICPRNEIIGENAAPEIEETEGGYGESQFTRVETSTGTRARVGKLEM